MTNYLFLKLLNCNLIWKFMTFYSCHYTNHIWFEFLFSKKFFQLFFEIEKKNTHRFCLFTFICFGGLEFIRVVLLCLLFSEYKWLWWRHFFFFSSYRSIGTSWQSVMHGFPSVEIFDKIFWCKAIFLRHIQFCFVLFFLTPKFMLLLYKFMGSTQPVS